MREVDDLAVGTGKPGEITRAVQGAFEDALHGRTERYAHWLDLVPVPRPPMTSSPVRRDPARRDAG